MVPVERRGRNDKRGMRVERLVATGRGNPLKAETQGRYRHEIGPEKLRAERSVRRLRKPEGVAQPGEANPVWVAACCRKRRRVENLMEGPFAETWAFGFGRM